MHSWCAACLHALVCTGSSRDHGGGWAFQAPGRSKLYIFVPQYLGISWHTLLLLSFIQFIPSLPRETEPKVPKLKTQGSAVEIVGVYFPCPPELPPVQPMRRPPDMSKMDDSHSLFPKKIPFVLRSRQKIPTESFPKIPRSFVRQPISRPFKSIVGGPQGSRDADSNNPMTRWPRCRWSCHHLNHGRL